MGWYSSFVVFLNLEVRISKSLDLWGGVTANWRGGVIGVPLSACSIALH